MYCRRVNLTLGKKYCTYGRGEPISISHHQKSSFLPLASRDSRRHVLYNICGENTVQVPPMRLETWSIQLYSIFIASQKSSYSQSRLGVVLIARISCASRFKFHRFAPCTLKHEHVCKGRSRPPHLLFGSFDLFRLG